MCDANTMEYIEKNRKGGKLMYDELVRLLRSEECVPYTTMHTMQEAADAIEELQETRVCRIVEKDGETELFIENRWVPVTEKLPEKDGAYLACFGNGLITTDTFMTFEDGHTKWYDGGYDIGGITHWMPLPQPPKEET